MSAVMTKRRKDRDLPPSVPEPSEIVGDLASIQTLAFRLVSLYKRAHADVFETLVSTSLLTFQSRGVDAGNTVGAAALARGRSREDCLAAKRSILLAIGNLTAATETLSPKPPSTAHHVQRQLSTEEIEKTQRRRDMAGGLPPDTTGLRADGSCDVCGHHWSEHRSVGASRMGQPVGICLRGRELGERCRCGRGWRHAYSG